MAYKIAVVGDKDSIMPFKMIGFDTFFCRQPQEARETIQTLANQHYGIIYVTEQIAQIIPEVIAYYRNKSIPAVILIPNYKGSLNIGLNNIQENVEKAIGQNIL
ncbi:V-type ATP synthase subunit F [Granulicatella sp. zg-ZJ]|uniref:V-type ATP synthase subunit F n=1 Tax=unclassified Granulicatella TaxID=2630493 RepID=UPI0013C1C0AE|nr:MULTISPECIES: V-type ATP synthase subunit F [unclassified Granulicatella]MBS4749538.1 V-type ATP synthase subunit F [Carnobacteriaceae bacterium zg-ZUI78]NEW62701.1 V-type ATP synthase subunit F [Granulicatella sp. zg-ZJ]NEW65730.1 V-type ATP synthase subunit F [Granulicatella sp. zg-84]QMI86516.1 V-type ATP synthase subunit F [Carnobacteriaceae bacterium zg-84]